MSGLWVLSGMICGSWCVSAVVIRFVSPLTINPLIIDGTMAWLISGVLSTLLCLLFALALLASDEASQTRPLVQVSRITLRDVPLTTSFDGRRRK